MIEISRRSGTRFLADLKRDFSQIWNEISRKSGTRSLADLLRDLSQIWNEICRQSGTRSVADLERDLSPIWNEIFSGSRTRYLADLERDLEAQRNQISVVGRKISHRLLEISQPDRRPRRRSRDAAVSVTDLAVYGQKISPSVTPSTRDHVIGKRSR